MTTVKPPGCQEYIPAHSSNSDAIQSMGFYPKASYFLKAIRKPEDLVGRIDPHFQQILVDGFPHTGTYGFAKANSRSEQNALKRIDVEPLKGPADREAWHYAKSAVLDLLAPHIGRYGLTPSREVDISDTAGGPTAKLLGFKSRKPFFATLVQGKSEQELWNFRETNVHFGSSTKEEPLPMDKIVNYLLRLFNPVDPVLEILCKMLFGKMDQGVFQRGGIECFATGFVKQYGGFNELMDWLMRVGDERVIREGDVSKYDSHFWVWIRDVCRDIRLELLDPSVPLYARTTLIWVYSVLTRLSTIVTMSGQILTAPFWMKSGDYLTSKDNSLAHLLIIFYVIYRCGMRYNSSEMRLKIMADDHIFGLLPHVAAKWTLLKSVEYYRELGHDLKPPPLPGQPTTDTSWDSGTVSGHSFLGGVATLIRGKWLGVPNSEKLIASFIHSPRRESLVHRFTRLRSLVIEAFPNRPLYLAFKGIFLQYYVFLRSMDVDLSIVGVDDTGLKLIPTDGDLWKFYLGDE